MRAAIRERMPLKYSYFIQSLRDIIYENLGSRDCQKADGQKISVILLHKYSVANGLGYRVNIR